MSSSITKIIKEGSDVAPFSNAIIEYDGKQVDFNTDDVHEEVFDLLMSGDDRLEIFDLFAEDPEYYLRLLEFYRYTKNSTEICLKNLFNFIFVIRRNNLEHIKFKFFDTETKFIQIGFTDVMTKNIYTEFSEIVKALLLTESIKKKQPEICDLSKVTSIDYNKMSKVAIFCLQHFMEKKIETPKIEPEIITQTREIVNPQFIIDDDTLISDNDNFTFLPNDNKQTKPSANTIFKVEHKDNNDNLVPDDIKHNIFSGKITEPYNLPAIYSKPSKSPINNNVDDDNILIPLCESIYENAVNNNKSNSKFLYEAKKIKNVKKELIDTLKILTTKDDSYYEMVECATKYGDEYDLFVVKYLFMLKNLSKIKNESTNNDEKELCNMLNFNSNLFLDFIVVNKM